MTIDIVSVILVIAMCGLFLCIAMGLAIKWQAPEPGTRWWIAAFAAFSLGFCLTGLQGILPPLLGHATGTSLVIAGAGCLLIGVQRFFAVSMHFEMLVVVAVCANLVLSALFILVWPSVNWRVVSSNSIIPMLMLTCAWVLARCAPPRMLAPARLSAAVGVLLSALVLTRAGLALAAPPMASPIGFSLINVLVYFAAAMGQLTVGVCLYFMLMSRRTAALEALTATDPLTGALNRRGLDVAIDRAEHDFHRYATMYAVIAADLDNFKHINDAHGHAAGDIVLKRFADLCREDLRGDSVLARLGGEEFCALLPGCTLDDARTVAERMRRAFETAGIQAAGAGISCTVSLGVAQSLVGASDFGSVMRAADTALYRAKQGGRNRVEVSVA